MSGITGRPFSVLYAQKAHAIIEICNQQCHNALPVSGLRPDGAYWYDGKEDYISRCRLTRIVPVRTSGMEFPVHLRANVLPSHTRRGVP